MSVTAVRHSILVGLGLAITARPLDAQAPPSARTVWTLEGAAAGYLSDHPEGGPAGFGIALGLERRLTPKGAMRLSAGILKTVVTADDISLCHPLPDGGCLPDSVFPGGLLLLETLFVARPAASIPIVLVGGLGALLPRGEVAGHGAVENADAEVQATAAWRLGFEVPIGTSLHAPRIQVTRLGLLREMLSLNGMFGLTLQLRLGSRKSVAGA
jgi:hypothetical protein